MLHNLNEFVIYRWDQTFLSSNTSHVQLRKLCKSIQLCGQTTPVILEGLTLDFLKSFRYCSIQKTETMYYHPLKCPSFFLFVRQNNTFVYFVQPHMCPIYAPEPRADYKISQYVYKYPLVLKFCKKKVPPVIDFPVSSCSSYKNHVLVYIFIPCKHFSFQSQSDDSIITYSWLLWQKSNLLISLFLVNWSFFCKLNPSLFKIKHCYSKMSADLFSRRQGLPSVL